MNKLIEILRKNNIGCRYGSEYIRGFCYADDLSLLCPSFTEIKEMLKTCEDYAMNDNILFNAKNNQMLTFDHKSRISIKTILKMRNDKEITYGTDCNHLGNILSTMSDFPIVDHAINDLYMRICCLLADFFLRIVIYFHVYLILIAQIFMVVHCGNIVENSWNHSIFPGENVSEEFRKFLILHLMF